MFLGRPGYDLLEVKLLEKWWPPKTFLDYVRYTMCFKQIWILRITEKYKIIKPVHILFVFSVQ